MNRGVMQSPSWWSHANNTMRPPTSHHHHHHHHDNHHHHQESANSTSSSPFMAPPDHIPHNLFPHLTPPQLPTPSSTHSLPFSSWINDSQLRLPSPADSWSQLILGGLVVDGDKSDGMANWEGQQQLLSQGTTTFDTKQQNVINTSAANSCYIYGGGIENNADFLAKPSTNYNNNNNNNWSQSSPSKSCITTLSCTDTMLNSSNTIVMSPRARHPPPDHSSECISTATTGGAPKKPRLQPSSSSQSTFKVRKEKLGDRITALHQLVSPFGKTDTASVLLEAIGYVRFLQSQIEALSLPYLATATSHDQTISHHQQSTVIQGEMNTLFPEDPGQVSSNEESKKDLKSRGLCLVPISSTLQVGNNNGADYWAPTPYGGVGFL